MKITITNCTDCPFMSHGTDSRYNDYYKCTLKKYLSEDYVDNTIAIYDLSIYEHEIVQPEWCPLLNDKVEIEYDNK